MKFPFLSSGTLQTDRANEMLQPDYIDVDEKTTADFLVFVKQYAELLRYWNDQSNPQGNWQVFFNEDLSILLAYIGYVDISKFPKQHDEYTSDFHNTPLEYEKEKILIRLLQLNLEIFNLIRDWYNQIQNQALQDLGNTDIEIMITELVKSNIWIGSLEIKHCFKRMQMFFNQNPNTTAHQNLGAPIHFAQEFFETLEQGEQKKKLIIEFNAYDQFFNYLDQLYQSLYGTISLIQQSVPSFLKQSLEQANHTPHVSLLLAFWEMMGETKQLVNQFTAKHLDFYYFNILQQQYAASIPDKVLLYFVLKPSETQAFLPAGASFVAGKSPSGQALLYELDKDLAINQTQPLIFKTLYNGTANTPIGTASPNLIYATPIANSGDGQGGKFLKSPASWPSLGIDLKNENSPNLGQFGFAVSNPILYLSEGNRQITVVLKLDDESIDFLKQEIIKIGINELDYWEGLELLINQSFSVEYTGSKGWLSPTETDIWLLPLTQNDEKQVKGKKKVEMGITFFLEINPTQAAVSAYNSKVHGPGYATTDPVLRFKIAQQITLKKSELSQKIKKESKWNKKSITLNPYPLLSQITIEEIPIYVEVENVQNFSIQNDFSALNPKKPYAPFGATPVCNNHFYLGNNEVFRKKLNFLALKIQWFDLPQSDKGFCDYYHDYNLFNKKKPFHNSIFKWKLDLLTANDQPLEKKWKPLDFTSKLKKANPAKLPPLNPSDPNAAQHLYDNLAEAATHTGPPESISPDLASSMLGKLGKYYGSNWMKNQTASAGTATKQGLTPSTEEEKKSDAGHPESVSPKLASGMLNDLGKHYGPNWSKNKPPAQNPTGVKNEDNEQKPSDPTNALKPDVVKKVVGDLSKHYGPNWSKNNPDTSDGVNPPLFIYSGSNFQGKPVIADTEFKDALDRLNQYAVKNKVKVHVTSSFRTSTNVKGAIVKPAKMSNHLVGHAIDMNLIFNGNETANSQYLNRAHEDIWDPAVKGFINDIEQDKGLKWGGDFNTQDPVHIDDRLNVNNPKKWKERYKLTQAAWKSKPYNGNGNDSQSDTTDGKKGTASKPPLKKPSKKTVAQKLAEQISQVLPVKPTQETDPETVATPTPSPDNSKKQQALPLANSAKNPSLSKAIIPPKELQDSTIKSLQPQTNPTKDTAATSSTTPKNKSKHPKKEAIGNHMFEWEVIETPKKEKKEEDKKKKKKPPIDDKKKEHTQSIFDFFSSVQDQLSDPKKVKKLNNHITKVSKASKTSNIAGTVGFFGIINPFGKKNTTSAVAPVSTVTPVVSVAPKPPVAVIKPPTYKCPPSEGKLRSESLVLINDFDKIKWKKVTDPTSFSKKITFNNQSKDGFLRFTLTAPDYAFGEAEYPRVIAAVANHNIDLMAQKLTKSTTTDTIPAGNTPTEKLTAFMGPIETFLKSPLLKLIEKLQGVHIKKPFKDALKAAEAIQTIIKNKKVETMPQEVSTYLETISKFLYIAGVAIHKFSSVASGHKKRSGPIKKTFMAAFGRLPIIKGLESALSAINPVVGGAVKLVEGTIKKKMAGDAAAISKQYTAALTASSSAITFIETLISGEGDSTLSDAPPVTLLPPRPAYIPKISKISANYSAKDTIKFRAKTEGQFFHLHPFGLSQIQANTKKINLLPVYAEEGYLFIALEKVNAPEIVTLLFDLNAESGNRDLPLPNIKWHYLDGEAWIPFLSASVKDGTNGLSQSGVTSFYLPYVEKSNTNLFLDHPNAGQYYWLKASVTSNAAAVCEIIQVYAQAGVATYAGGDSDPSHFDQPLPAKKISKPYQSLPEIAKVNQPLASFGGRAHEENPEFYTRVNERLRHKGRAVTSWDFERLILQAFPDIGFVRCLNHTSLSKTISPGSISIIILPENSSANQQSLFPKTDQGQIGMVSRYLENIVDPFAQLYVRNPKYLFLKLKLKVVLSPGLDPGHYLKILNKGLIAEIAPWSNGTSGINPFETKISYFSILEYINRQLYVEEVAVLKIVLLKSITAKSGKQIKKSFDQIELKKPWMIISSVEQHDLSVISKEQLILARAAEQTKEEKKGKKKATKKMKKTQKKPVSNNDPISTVKPNIPKKDPPASEPKKQNALYIGNDLYKKPH